MKTFLIEYEIYKGDRLIKSGKIRVKNQENEMYAKVNLEKYLKRKDFNFDRMIVCECKEDFFGTFGFGKEFGDIFGGKGGFGL